MKREKKRRVWRTRIILNTCLAVVLPLLLISACFSALYMRFVQENIVSQNEAYVNMTAVRMEQALSKVKTQVMQWANDNEGLSSANVDFAADHLTHSRIVSSLEWLLASNDWMERVMYYQVSSGTIVDTEYGRVVLSDYKYSPALDQARDSAYQSTWMNLSYADGRSELVFMYKLPSNAYAQERDIVLAVISRGKLAVEINPMPGIMPDAFFTLLDSVDNRLYPLGDAEAILPPDWNALAGSGTLEFSHAGQAHLCTYATTNEGWRLLASGARGALLSEACWVLQMAIGIVLFGTLLSILSIASFSRWIYRPFQELAESFDHLMPEPAARTGQMDEVAYLHDALERFNREKKEYIGKWQSAQPAVVRQYLRALLHNGRYAVMERMPDSLPQHSGVIVAMMWVETYRKANEFLENERPLALGAVENIAQELLDEQPTLRGIVLSHYPEGFTVVCFPDGSLCEEEVSAGIRAYCAHVQEAVLHYLDIYLAAGVGRLYENHLDASLSHNEAHMALRYNLLTAGSTQSVCLYAEVRQYTQADNLSYPQQHEARLLAHLKDGQMEAAARDLEAFTQQAQASGSFLFCNQACMLLLAKLIQTIIKDGKWVEMLLEDDLFLDLSSCQTIVEVQSWMEKRVFPFFSALQEREDVLDSARRQVEAVCAYVGAHVTGDLSLVQCAAACGISASYLSRIFKRSKGVSFLEYVTAQKMDYVKARLCETAKSIGDIAEEIGCSERTLYRTFIKTQGVSPGAYREQRRTPGADKR